MSNCYFNQCKLCRRLKTLPITGEDYYKQCQGDGELDQQGDQDVASRLEYDEKCSSLCMCCMHRDLLKYGHTWIPPNFLMVIST